MDQPQDDGQLITCVDCGAQFNFSAKDKAFYQQRGYQAPRRCKTCRDKRKKEAGGGHGAPGAGAPYSATPPAGGAAPAPAQYKVSCTACGIETTVPFKPDPNRPVFCRNCYLNKRQTQ